MEKGVAIPNFFRVWERRELPPAGSGSMTARAPTENEFGYSTAVSIAVVTITLILRCMFYTRKLNKKVSYRKHIERQHCVAQSFG